METRRQSEKHLQKAREKEKAQATRISDEEKRNSAITNAMKHWLVVKKDHKKLIRKASDASTSTSDPPPSKGSDNMEISNSCCEDTVSNTTGEVEEEKLEVAATSDKGEEEIGEDKKDEAQEDDRTSIISVTSSGISDISLVHKGTERRLSTSAVNSSRENVTVNALNNSIQAIKQFKLNSPRTENKINLSRSKSYTDMRVLRRKNSFEGDGPSRSKSVRAVNSDVLGGVGKASEKISIDAATKATVAVKNVPVVRRVVTRLGSAQNRGTEKSRPRIMANEVLKHANSKNSDLLKKSESLKGAGHLPDKIVTAAITRVRSNLSLPIQSPETPVSPRNAVSEPSEIDSSSDAESATTATTTNTAATPTSSVEPTSQPSNRPHHNLADLRIPLSRSKDLEKPTCDKEKTLPAANPNPTGILREQGPNFLAELEGERLNLYGQGALRCTDIPWDKTMASGATTARFQYMNFEDIVDIFPKLRVKFPRLENFVFVETHLTKCSQLNALAELHQVTSLEVGREGNPLTQTPYWRLYAIFRLTHWGLRVIDNVEVSEEERTEAAVMFSPLSQLAFTCLPRDQLSAFLSTHQHHTTCPSPGSSGQQDVVGSRDMEAPRLNVPHLQDLIGKEALQHRPTARLTQDESMALVFAGRQARQLAVWTFDSLHRLHIHHSTWPSVLHDLVRDAVTDLAKPTYGKQCLEDVKRSLGWKK